MMISTRINIPSLFFGSSQHMHYHLLTPTTFLCKLLLQKNILFNSWQWGHWDPNASFSSHMLCNAWLEVHWPPPLLWVCDVSPKKSWSSWWWQCQKSNASFCSCMLCSTWFEVWQTCAPTSCPYCFLRKIEKALRDHVMATKVASL